MTRYFQAFVTARPIEVDGQFFIFERIEPMGGSWLGVLAVDDPVAANKLAAAGYEITQERFDGLKKKVMGTARPSASVQSRMPQPPPLPLVQNANPVGLRGSSGDDASATAGSSDAIPASGVDARAPLASVSLLTTNQKPPPEPMLETPVRRKRRSA